MADPKPQPDAEPQPEAEPTAPRQPDAEPTPVEPTPPPSPPAEPVRAEVVHVERQPEQPSALERAAEAALAMPGFTGRDEFLTLAMTAKMLSLSGAAPKAVKNNPHVAFHVAMIGRDLGISPSAAIQQIDVIGEGDKTTISLSPELLNGQVRRLGLGSVIPACRTNDLCIAVAVGPGGVVDDRCKAQAQKAGAWPMHVEECRCQGVLGETEFTWEDAQIAGLVDNRCAGPRDHWKPQNGNGHCGCRQGWKTYPKRMLWWRAAGYCTSDYFPEAGLGLYSPEELGAVVDETGRPIDPANVALPDGYDKALPAAGGTGGGTGGGSASAGTGEAADAETTNLLQLRVLSLPEANNAELRNRWKNLDRLKGKTLYRLPVEDVKLVEALIRGQEEQAKAQGWDRDEAHEHTAEQLAECAAAALGHVTTAEDPTSPQEDTSGEEASNTPDPEPEPAEAHTAPLTPADAEEAKRLLRTTPREVLDALVAEVEQLKGGEVDRNLAKLGQVKTGNVATRQQRLVIAALAYRDEHGQLPDLFGDDDIGSASEGA